MGFFCCMIYPGHRIIFSYPISLTSSGLFLFLMALTVFRSTCQGFYRMPHHWAVSDVFLMIRLELWIWGRKATRTKMPFTSSHIKSTHYNITYNSDVNLSHLSELVFVMALHWKVTLFFSFLERSHYVQSTLKRGDSSLSLYSLRKLLWFIYSTLPTVNPWQPLSFVCIQNVI